MSDDELPKWLSDHIDLFRTDPEKAHHYDGGSGIIDCLLLTTKGHKTGRTRHIPLLYGRDGLNYVLVASKMGAPKHPHWFLNLMSSPDPEIQVGRDHLKVTPRVAAGAERERLWALMTKIFPDYAQYQKNCPERELPVVVLEPKTLPTSWIDDHLALYRSDPEKAHRYVLPGRKDLGPITTLLLTTKGRKSGRDVVLPLIYSESGNSFVVIASKGGAPDHPSWYKNLVANPDCGVQVASRHYRARARTATGEERAKLWAQMQKIWPPYDEYAKRAGERQIPVVVLEPRS